jgi:hypothetical protein
MTQTWLCSASHISPVPATPFWFSAILSHTLTILDICVQFPKAQRKVALQITSSTSANCSTSVSLSDRHHVVVESLRQRPLHHQELPVGYKCASAFRSFDGFFKLWNVGTVLGSSSTGQCIPARCRKGECHEGADNRRCVNKHNAGDDANAEAEGELVDFVDEFSDGKIQFGFLRVKDPNTSLLKYVLVGWVSCQLCFDMHTHVSSVR